MAAPMGQQSANPSAPPQNPAAQVQAQKEAEVDPIIKIKQLLLPRLKESLVALMKVAGQILHQNSMSEEGHKLQEGLQQVYEKSIEEFYAICDQLEVNLRLALEMQAQQIDSNKYTPLPVTIPKSDMTMSEQQSVPYPQFLVTVKHQITCAKDMYEMLNEFTKKLTER
ncbi:mediator of RNA polymerase II transcription subunit 29-like [Mercenaria mercenaria]|uniref:mediator of RNA polymerase II transcription subunit 29-like n=1 Tax=Mercenaria mercenaria TaxID=6596 RepID=UPI00234EB3F7|nr:mediator of RNA polymerase II transcription subunit 29-like [Mercenaria mercenaria]